MLEILISISSTVDPPWLRKKGNMQKNQQKTSHFEDYNYQESVAILKAFYEHRRKCHEKKVQLPPTSRNPFHL